MNVGRVPSPADIQKAIHLRNWVQNQLNQVANRNPKLFLQETQMKNIFILLLSVALLICTSCSNNIETTKTTDTSTPMPLSTPILTPTLIPTTTQLPKPTPTPTINPEALKYFDQGFDYSNNGDREKAIEAYTKSIELNPEFALAWSNRGLQYAFLNEHDLAIDDFTTAISLDPMLAAAYRNRGSSYTYLEKYELALSDFNDSLSLENKNSASFVNRAQVYIFLMNEDKAVIDYLQALNYSSDANFSNFVIAQLETLGVLSDFNLASEAYNEGNTYARNDDYLSAIESYTEAINIFPLFYYAYLNRGTSYLNLALNEPDIDKLSNAVSDFSSGVELTPLDPIPWYWRGLCHSILSESDLAIPDFEMALSLGLPQTLEDSAMDLLEHNKSKK